MAIMSLLDDLDSDGLEIIKRETERKLVEKDLLIRELEGKISLLTAENDRLIQINNDKSKEIEILR